MASCVEPVVVFLVDALLVDNFVDKDSTASALLTQLLTQLLTKLLAQFLTQVFTKVLTKLLTKLLNQLLTQVLTKVLRKKTQRHPHLETDISSRVRTILEPSGNENILFYFRIGLGV